MEKFTIASPQSDSYPKKRSRQKWIPWLAFASLLAVLLCLGASVAVIILSDRQNVASWPVQPAVALAILAALSNVALGIAFSEAVVAAWWASAANGTSLKELHYIWNRGEGLTFFSALSAGPSAKKVALTMLALISIKVATGPLLQRATRQRIEDIWTGETMKLNVAQRLPPGWTGTVESSSSTLGSTNSVYVTRDWFLKAPINNSYCDGTCEGSLPGAGITYNCSSTTRPLDLLAGNGGLLFGVNTTLSQTSAGAPFLLLTTAYSSAINGNCTADITIETCKIEAGIVDYPVIIWNSSIKLDPAKLNDDIVRSRYSDPGDLPTATVGTKAGALRGLHHFALIFYSRTTVSGSSTYNGNLMAKMFVQIDSSAYDDYTYDNCALKWYSPTDYVLTSFHDFMFRAALRAAKPSDSQEFSILRAKRTLVFHSVYGYLTAATIVTIFGVFFVLIRLEGWWSLRRTVSLSPLETAKAFSAPLMERALYNDTADDMLKDIGQIQVRYIDGVMVVDDDSRSLLTDS